MRYVNLNELLSLYLRVMAQRVGDDSGPLTHCAIRAWHNRGGCGSNHPLGRHLPLLVAYC